MEDGMNHCETLTKEKFLNPHQGVQRWLKVHSPETCQS